VSDVESSATTDHPPPFVSPRVASSQTCIDDLGTNPNLVVCVVVPHAYIDRTVARVVVPSLYTVTKAIWREFESNAEIEHQVLNISRDRVNWRPGRPH
jgi:hypothetical protein